jgi:hypothetical protein
VCALAVGKATHETAIVNTRNNAIAVAIVLFFENCISFFFLLYFLRASYFVANVLISFSEVSTRKQINQPNPSKFNLYKKEGKVTTEAQKTDIQQLCNPEAFHFSLAWNRHDYGFV